MIYTPNGWVILKLESSETLYFKIFGTWRGDYLTGDSWRLSSGSDKKPKLSECRKYWIWPQESGSCYRLPVNQEGRYTTYTGLALSKIIRCTEGDNLIEEIKLSDVLVSELS